MGSRGSRRDTYESLQSIKGYYEFNDVDADRYVLNGQKTQVLTSTRELNPSGLPDSGRSWVNRHLQYTHGYGAVIAPANAANADGNPVFTLQDVPPVGEPKITQPRVYFGENLGGYAIVNTKQTRDRRRRLDVALRGYGRRPDCRACSASSRSRSASASSTR